MTATNTANTMTATTAVLVEEAISGLSATNNGPTTLGMTTTLTATISGGTNVSFTWDFGDGATGSGAVVTHTYAAPGYYTATVTATNAVSTQVATTMVPVEEVVTEFVVFLPAVVGKPQ